MPIGVFHCQKRRKNKSKWQNQWFLEDKPGLLCSLACSSSMIAL